MHRPPCLDRQTALKPAAPAARSALLALLFAAGVVAPAQAAVAIAIERPLDGDVLASPITIAASATPDAASARVTGWQVYLDGVQAYGTGPSPGLSTSLPMDDGDHEVIVRAWDSTGGYGSASLTVTIGICSGFTVDLLSPAAGSVTSPVQFVADASSCHRVTGFAVYVDGQRVHQQPGDSSLDALLDLPAGHHSVVVRATDATRATASSDAVPIDVEGRVVAQPPRQPGQPPARSPAPPPPPPPH